VTTTQPTVGPDPATGEVLTVVPVRHPGRWVAAAVLLVVVAQVVNDLVTNKNYQWSVFGDYFSSGQVLHGLRLTIELTVIAMAIGTALGTVLAIGRMSPNPVVRSAYWSFVWFFRGTPVLVQIVVWFNISALLPRLSLGIPFGPEFVHGSANTLITPFVAAILALGLNEAAYMSEIVRAGILSVDEGQNEAACALGMTRLQTTRRIVLPQAMRIIVPPLGNETISMLKTTALVSTISVTELLTSVQHVYSRTFQIIPLLMVAVVWYLIVTSVLYVGQFYLERMFSRGNSRDLPPTPAQRLVKMLSLRSPGPSVGGLGI
jgi:polar amino acid transport system permease protein